MGVYFWAIGQKKLTEINKRNELKNKRNYRKKSHFSPRGKGKGGGKMLNLYLAEKIEAGNRAGNKHRFNRLNRLKNSTPRN